MPKLWLIVAAISTSTATQPHIVHLVSDDTGWNDLSIHNGGQTATPQLDALFRDGIELTRFHTPPMCGPSRASLMTGRYPYRVGAYANGDIKAYGLPLEYSTLPEVLKMAGYATHMQGKWHIGYRTNSMTPTYRGFDSFIGLMHSGGNYINHLYSKRQAPAGHPDASFRLYGWEAIDFAMSDGADEPMVPAHGDETCPRSWSEDPPSSRDCDGVFSGASSSTTPSDASRRTRRTARRSTCTWPSRTPTARRTARSA